MASEQEACTHCDRRLPVALHALCSVPALLIVTVALLQRLPFQISQLLGLTTAPFMFDLTSHAVLILAGLVYASFSLAGNYDLTVAKSAGLFFGSLAVSLFLTVQLWALAVWMVDPEFRYL